MNKLPSLDLMRKIIKNILIILLPSLSYFFIFLAGPPCSENFY